MSLYHILEWFVSQMVLGKRLFSVIYNENQWIGLFFLTWQAQTGYRGLARYASTSAVATKSSGGFFSWLTGEKSSSLPPLDFPLKDVVLPPPLPDHVEPGKTKITTLPNGLRIASETSAVGDDTTVFFLYEKNNCYFYFWMMWWLIKLVDQNPAASIGLYVDCGSIYETPASYGATHLLERIAFKSTTNRSHLRIVREVEAIGGNVTASASREHMSYTYDALKTYVPQMVELLIDCVRNPAFLDWEVSEQVYFVVFILANSDCFFAIWILQWDFDMPFSAP